MIKASEARKLSYDNYNLTLNIYIEENREILNQQMDLIYSSVERQALSGGLVVTVDKLIFNSSSFDILIKEKCASVGYKVSDPQNCFAIHWA